ncbi:sigma-54-dependent Fis family transcriptional regulator [candidate division KSB1 bacterium]|nr:sigma-54-dependent Fis family transcriptional regulator [candidate division KSB1 bacterium]
MITRVLLIDDDVDALQALRMGIESEYALLTATSYKEAVYLLGTQDIDIVVTDLKLKDGSGLQILTYVHEHLAHISVIVITAYGTVETAIQSIRSGAYEYLVKPFRLADLKRLLTRLAETQNLRKENSRLRQVLQLEKRNIQFVTVSNRMKRIYELAQQIAESKTTVLISGETGTGKDVLANLLHSFSQRYQSSFVKIDCASIPENLLEAELFGYEKGAFTGASSQKRGKLEMAHQGTAFLDEIGELTPFMQSKLLRFLQDGEFERLGGTHTLNVDVRVLAATNADLEKKVKDGSFRSDLFYRLNVIAIHMPPLREHVQDIPFLIQSFIEKYNALNNKQVQSVDPQVIKHAQRYSWPGNIRELENMVERAVVLSREPVLSLIHFPGLAVGPEAAERTIGVTVGMSLAEIEKLAIEKNLIYYNNDKNRVAQVLQTGLATLYRKIKEYRIGEP